MQILLYLRSQSIDAALVEMVSRHSLSEYDGIMEDENYEIVDEIHIRVCGSDIYLGKASPKPVPSTAISSMITVITKASPMSLHT